MEKRIDNKFKDNVKLIADNFKYKVNDYFKIGKDLLYNDIKADNNTASSTLYLKYPNDKLIELAEVKADKDEATGKLNLSINLYLHHLISEGFSRKPLLRNYPFKKIMINLVSNSIVEDPEVLTFDFAITVNNGFDIYHLKD